MAEWTERTIRNWRWWLALPCILALAPILVIDFALWVTTWCATFAHDTADNGRDFLSATFKPYTRALGAWARKGVTK